MNKSKKFAAGGGIYEPKELQPSRQQKLSEKDGFRTTDELQPQKQLKPRTGTTEGTDQASAERNLRQDYENLKLDEKVKKEYEAYEKSKPKKMAKGGSASSRADGCAVRGKTKGRMV